MLISGERFDNKLFYPILSIQGTFIMKIVNVVAIQPTTTLNATSKIRHAHEQFENRFYVSTRESIV